MPGGPNKPPDVAPPPAPPVTETPEQRALRRLAPSRVALRLPLWRGAPSSELVDPYLDAEARFGRGDLAGADGALDRLSIRFAEPRWPSLPAPFKELRVPIPNPQPPHWDPDHGLPAAEKEARRMQRYAATQLALARASVEEEAARGTAVDDLRPLVEAAALEAPGAGPAFWKGIDQVWSALRERVPVPVASGRPTPAPGGEDVRP
jgi:hypothetical protein